MIDDFDEVPALRAEIRRLNAELDRARLDNGDLGERLAVAIQANHGITAETQRRGGQTSTATVHPPSAPQRLSGDTPGFEARKN